MGVIRVKPGVLFTTIAPGGVHILAALDCAATTLSVDLTITSACDGDHSGVSDPHHRGEAYDLRSHDFTADQKQSILEQIMRGLGTPSPASGGLVTEKFFGWLEQAGTDNEHFHVQVRKGTTYP